jgi:hypothetical protein
LELPLVDHRQGNLDLVFPARVRREAATPTISSVSKLTAMSASRP